MIPRILRSPDAGRDIVEIGSFIAEDSIEFADLFLEAVETTLLALAKMPRAGATRTFRNPQFVDVRIWRVKDFEKYLIFYRALDEGIQVLRVVHGARDLEDLFR